MKMNHIAGEQMIFDLFSSLFNPKQNKQVKPTVEPEKPAVVDEPVVVKAATAKPAAQQPVAAIEEEDVVVPDYTPEEQLAGAASEKVNLRRHIAACDHITDEAQDIFTHDKNDEVRMAMAGNLLVSEKNQETLSHDKSYVVRCFLAINTSISEKVQERYISDEAPEVRRLLACNPSLTKAACNALTKDRDKDTRLLALEAKAARKAQEQSLCV